jgi:MarR family 2-MHQ and catechol resistance regulon transcriptional repressor
MAVNAEQEKTVLRLWLLLRRVGDALNLCLDQVYSKYGVTTEQSGVLAAIKSRGPLRVTDMASIVERSPNSVSMIVDRMVKAGLVRRTRDRKDRRVVFVDMTDKGREAVDPVVPAGWKFIHKIVSPLSHEEQRSLATMLETIRCELVGYLNPEMEMGELVNMSVTRDPGSYRRLVKNVLPSGYGGEGKGSEKRNVV